MNEEGVRKEALAALKAALAESISMPSSLIFQIFRIFPIPRENSDFETVLLHGRDHFVMIILHHLYRRGRIRYVESPCGQK
jgi:hypothetical protein